MHLDDQQLNAILKITSRILAAKVELAAAENALATVLSGNLSRGAVPRATRITKSGKRLGRPPGSKNRPAGTKEKALPAHS